MTPGALGLCVLSFLPVLAPKHTYSPLRPRGQWGLPGCGPGSRVWGLSGRQAVSAGDTAALAELGEGVGITRNKTRFCLQGSVAGRRKKGSPDARDQTDAP